MASHLAVVSDDPPQLEPWRGVVRSHLTRFAGNTLAAYRRDLTAWEEWCVDHHLDPLRARAHDVEQYLDSIDLRAATKRRRLSAIASAFETAKTMGLITGDAPTAGIERPKPQARARSLDAAQARRLQACAADAGQFTAALVMLLMRAQLRVSEACNLHVEDLDLGSGRYSMRIGRRGSFAFDAETLVAIRQYLGARRTGALFERGDGTQLTRYDARRIVIRLIDAAGLPPFLSADDLRFADVE
ncbi:MAG: integrase/recombinase XerD [Acidimicrobiaceae bacterium]